MRAYSLEKLKPSTHTALIRYCHIYTAALYSLPCGTGVDKKKNLL